MKPELPWKNFLILQLKRVKNPFYICAILALYWLNDHVEIIKTKELAIAICGILICTVLLKDTIYKCLDRLCKRDEIIEKEKTKRLLAKDHDKNDKDPSTDNRNNSSKLNKNSNMQNSEGDVKVCDIKHRRSS